MKNNRIEELADYNPDLTGININEMSDEDFQQFKMFVKLNYEAEKGKIAHKTTVNDDLASESLYIAQKYDYSIEGVERDRQNLTKLKDLLRSFKMPNMATQQGNEICNNTATLVMKIVRYIDEKIETL